MKTLKVEPSLAQALLTRALAVLAVPLCTDHVQYTQTDTIRNYKLTIYSFTDHKKDIFRSVYDRKIVSHWWHLNIFDQRCHNGL